MTDGFTRRQTLAGAAGAGVAGASLLLGVGRAIGQPLRYTAAVATTAGQVRGRQVGRVANFLGIPYGGDTRQRRFQAPVAPEPWSGVRDCVALGHQCPQMEISGSAPPGTDLNSPFVQAVMAAGKQGMEQGNEGEDCLVLNLYTPEASPARKRPVMVWLHGGGFAMGSAGDPQYDGNALVRRGDVVVVTINHRLNALGYLYLGDLDPLFADSGNAGQLDIVLALQWVRDNIANFGGDPGNVTIFGESGGGSKVSVVMAMPAAQGLFHKAIIQSGPGLTMGDKAQAAAHGEATLAKLGLAKTDVRKLLDMDIREIMRAAGAAQGRGMRSLAPIVDGRALPRHPFSPDATPLSRDIPLMIGTTKDESTLFLSPDPLFGKMTEAQAVEKATAMLGPKGAEGIAVFKRLRPKDAPTYWLTSLMTASGTWINSIRLADRKLAQPAPVYMFRMDWETPFYGGALKAPHGTEVPFVFDNADKRPVLLGTGPVQRKLGAELSQAWINFARNGDPSQPKLAWPAYDTAERRTLIFDTVSHVTADPDKEARVLLGSA